MARRGSLLLLASALGWGVYAGVSGKNTAYSLVPLTGLVMSYGLFEKKRREELKVHGIMADDKYYSLRGQELLRLGKPRAALKALQKSANLASRRNPFNVFELLPKIRGPTQSYVQAQVDLALQNFGNGDYEAVKDTVQDILSVEPEMHVKYLTIELLHAIGEHGRSEQFRGLLAGQLVEEGKWREIGVGDCRHDLYESELPQAYVGKVFSEHSAALNDKINEDMWDKKLEVVKGTNKLWNYGPYSFGGRWMVVKDHGGLETLEQKISRLPVEAGVELIEELYGWACRVRMAHPTSQKAERKEKVMNNVRNKYRERMSIFLESIGYECRHKMLDESVKLVKPLEIQLWKDPIGRNLDMKTSNFFVEEGGITAFDKETFNEIKPVVIDLGNTYLTSSKNFIPFMDRLNARYCSVAGDDPESMKKRLLAGMIYRSADMLGVYSKGLHDHSRRLRILERILEVIPLIENYKHKGRLYDMFSEFKSVVQSYDAGREISGM